MSNHQFFKHIKSIHPTAILGMCLALTLVVSLLALRLINQRQQDHLSQLSEVISVRLMSRMNRYEKALLHINSYLKSDQHIDRAAFTHYVRQLNLPLNYPGIQGMGYTVRILHEQLAAYEESLRQQGFPEFEVWPDHPREEYFSIHFLEPFDWRNKRAFGFDMFSQPSRRAAMSKARDSGQAALTEAVVLVQETDRKTQPGFLIYFPLYAGEGVPLPIKERRARLQGFVYAPFRAHDFFNEIFLEDSTIHSEVRVKIYDGPSTKSEKLLYDNDLLFNEKPDPASTILMKRTIHPSDHTWTIVTILRKNPALFLEKLFPWFMALIGSLLSFLIYWIVHSARSHAADMETSLTRFNALVENLTEGLIFAHPNGDIQLMNKVASEIYHFSLFDQTFWKRAEYNSIINFKTMNGEDVALQERPISRVVRGEKYDNYELEFHHLATGSKRFISYGGTPIYNKTGKLVLVVVTVKDITEKKEKELELQKALAARDEFVSISSHELKTPLTSLKLKAQLFRRKLNSGKNVNTEEVIKFSEETDRQISRLTRLVEDMLDVSRLRSGQFSLSKEIVNIRDLMNSIIDQIKPQFLAAGQQPPLIEFNGDATGEWDVLRIEQVINNLLTNAIRYGEGKPVSIQVKALNNCVQICIKDQGAGISPEQQARIFNRFERLNEVHETTGLGLGLFLSQKIVLAHEGKIWVESEPGRGSCFTVELPTIRI